MKIKNILTTCFVCCGLTTVLTSCSDDDAFFTAGADDAPRILNTDFPDGGFSIKRDENLKFDILVTPADYTTIKWLVDDVEVFVGRSIDMPFEAGDYTLKIVATTVPGKETSRTMKLTVSPLDGDPVGGNDIMERYQEPGTLVTLSGSNMSSVKKVRINGCEMDVVNATDNSIQYIIPADMPEGKYRLSFINSEGMSFGGGIVNVSGQAIVTESFFISAIPGRLTLLGRKLDCVTEITIDNQACTIVSQQADKMVVELPALADGSYTMKATTKNGTNMMFIKDGALVDAAPVMVAQVVINQSDFIGMSAGQVTFAGLNLNNISAITVNGLACTIVSQSDESLVVELPELPEGTFEVRATTTSGGTVKFIKDDQLVEVASIKVSLIAEDILWQGNYAIDWGTIWEDDGTVTTKLKELAKPRAILRLYVKRTADDYCIGCAAVDWADIVRGGKDPNRGDVNINFEDTYVDFVLTKKSMELINSGNLQVVGHGFNITKITIIQPGEEELWAGKYAIDWGTIWEDDGTITAQLKDMAGVGSVLRLYVKRTADDYCIGCAAVDWADIVRGGKDPNRGDVNINFEDNCVEFVFTEKSMELLDAGNLQVVGHGFDLLKITIQ